MVNRVEIGRRGFWDGLGRAHWNALAVHVHQQKTWVPVPEQGGGGESMEEQHQRGKPLSTLFSPGGGSFQSPNQDLSLGDKWMKIDRYMRKQGL